MTKQEIDAIRARCEAAAPGPWKHHYGDDYAVVMFPGEGTSNASVRVAEDEWDDSFSGNAKFIAHAREDIPRLLAEVRVLRQELFEARQSLDDGTLCYFEG